MALAEEYDVVVCGGGLAGLTAALFAARLGRSTLALVGDLVGGHLTNVDVIPDFPGFPGGVAGYELCPKVQEQAANAGAEFRASEAVSLTRAEAGWLIEAGVGDVVAPTVIVATGSRPRRLGVPGEERFEGRGVSHCASCDGPLLRGGAAVVVGGGDSAFQEALTLADYASEVTIVFRSAESVAQAAHRRAALARGNVTLLANATVQELLGGDMVEGVRLRVAGEPRELAAKGVWTYVGLEPNTAWLNGALPLDDSGHIITDAWLRTALDGVFAAGDVRSDSASQAITAAGDGATAAVAADRFLKLGR